MRNNITLVSEREVFGVEGYDDRLILCHRRELLWCECGFGFFHGLKVWEKWLGSWVHLKWYGKQMKGAIRSYFFTAPSPPSLRVYCFIY